MVHAPCPNRPMVDLGSAVSSGIPGAFRITRIPPWKTSLGSAWFAVMNDSMKKNNQKHNSSWVTRLATRPTKFSPRPLATPSTLEVGMRVQVTNLGNTIAGSRSSTINLAGLWGLLPDMNLIIYHIYSALMWWFWGNQLWATSRNKTNKRKPNIAQHSPTSI